jgi:predicted Zn-dependent peptidase
MNKYKLNNGIKVLEYNLKNFNSLYIAIIVKVGSRNESEEVAGLSHFLEHILFKGTEKYPKPFDQ